MVILGLIPAYIPRKTVGDSYGRVVGEFYVGKAE